MGQEVPIRCVHGDIKLYPLVSLPISLPSGVILTAKNGILPSLPEELILGQDNPSFLMLLKNSLRVIEAHTSPQPSLLTQAPWVSDKSFRYNQLNNPTLQTAWDHGRQTSPCQKPVYPLFCLQNELLYRMAKEGDTPQLAVPQAFREQVIFYAHSHLLAGHRGTQKTIDMLLCHFYWSGIFAQVTKFCRECEICQRRTPYKPPPVPLQPLPIIGTPFARIGMDLIGPLPRTKKGNLYALVVVDYATRYPEAFPLHAHTCQNISDKLLELFSGGLPT